MKKFEDLKLYSRVYQVSYSGKIKTYSIGGISGKGIDLNGYNSMLKPESLRVSEYKDNYSNHFFTEMSNARKHAIEILRKKRQDCHLIILNNLEEIAAISHDIESLK